MSSSNPHDLPPEIWHDIFRLACTDTGNTGRSLSLVSKGMNEISKPFKYQSIAVIGIQQLIKFVPHFQGLPPEGRRVKWLCIVTEHIFGDLDENEDGKYRLPASDEQRGLSWFPSPSVSESDCESDDCDVGLNRESDGDDDDDGESTGYSTDSEELEYAEITTEEVQEVVEDLSYLAHAGTNIDPDYVGYQYQEHPSPDMIAEEEIEKVQAKIQGLVNFLLELCSNTVCQLVVDVSFRHSFNLPIILPPSCPHLWELATKNPIHFPDQINGHPVYPTLERLCVLPEGDIILWKMLPQIQTLLPNLTHLRIPSYDGLRSLRFSPIDEYLKSTKNKPQNLIVDHHVRFIPGYIIPRLRQSLRELVQRGDIKVAHVGRNDGKTIQRWLRDDDSFWRFTPLNIEV